MMDTKRKPRARTSISFEEEVLTALRRTASQEDKTVSGLLEELVRIYLDSKGVKL